MGNCTNKKEKKMRICRNENAAIISVVFVVTYCAYMGRPTTTATNTPLNYVWNINIFILTLNVWWFEFAYRCVGHIHLHQEHNTDARLFAVLWRKMWRGHPDRHVDWVPPARLCLRFYLHTRQKKNFFFLLYHTITDTIRMYTHHTIYIKNTHARISLAFIAFECVLLFIFFLLFFQFFRFVLFVQNFFVVFLFFFFFFWIFWSFTKLKADWKTKQIATTANLSWWLSFEMLIDCQLLLVLFSFFVSFSTMEIVWKETSNIFYRIYFSKISFLIIVYLADKYKNNI